MPNLPPPPPNTQGGSSPLPPRPGSAPVPSMVGAPTQTPGVPAAQPALPAPIQLPAEIAEQTMELANLADSSWSNSATLIVGDTGSGKSELLRTAAEYCYETYGMITRLYAGDPGGFGTETQALMRLGIVQAWRMRNHVEPFETCELASMGYWPETVDPLTGYAEPNVRLIPPTITQYLVLCPHGHQAQPPVLKQRAISPQVVCPTCRDVVNANNWTIHTRTLRSPGFRLVGLFGYEGLSAWSSWVMDDMAARAGRDELGGERGAIDKIVSGELVLGSNNRAHYGFAQNRAQAWVINSTKIPGAVMPPIWTALELRASDEGGLPIYGPKIAGKARTDEVPSWFGNCLNAETTKDDRGQEIHRLWLVTHRYQHEGNIPHLAKHRSDPQLMPQYLEDLVIPGSNPPVRQPFSGFSLKTFFTLLAAAISQSVQRQAAKYPGAPAFTGGLALDAEEQEAAALLARPAAPSTTPTPQQVVAQAPKVAAVPPVVPAVGAPMAPVAPPAMVPPAMAPPPPPVPQQRPPVLPPQQAVPQASPAPQAAQAPKAPQAAPLPPAAPPVPAAPPQAPPVQASPTALPPVQPVSISGPSAAPVRPATAPPPPPVGVAPAPPARKAAVAQVLPAPPPGGGK